MSPGMYTDQNWPPSLPERMRARSVWCGVFLRRSYASTSRSIPFCSRIAHGRSLCPSVTGDAVRSSIAWARAAARLVGGLGAAFEERPPCAPDVEAVIARSVAEQRANARRVIGRIVRVEG